MITRKLIALGMAFCMLLTIVSAPSFTAKAEESFAVSEEIAEVAAPQPAPEEYEEIIEAPASFSMSGEQMAEDEVVLDSTPMEGTPLMAPEEDRQTLVLRAEKKEDYGDGPVYVLEEGGVRHFGQPEEFIPLDKTIYLNNYYIIEIEGYTVSQLRNVHFALGGGFKQTDAIYLSQTSPGGRTADGVVFMWAGPYIPGSANAYALEDVITAEEEDYLETEIMVQAQDYASDAPCLPTFALTAIPEPEEGMVFAVSLDGGEAQILTGSSFAPSVSGEYRFLLLSADGAELARSNKYPVELEAQEIMADDSIELIVPSMPEEDEDVHMDLIFGQEPEISVETAEPVEVTLEDIMEQYSGAEMAEEGYEEDRVELFGGEGSIMADELIEAEAQPVYTLSVTPGKDAVSTGWNNRKVAFTLASDPALAEGHGYAAFIDGAAVDLFTESSYTLSREGEYTLSFAIVDEDGTVLASADDTYEVKMDLSAPLLIATPLDNYVLRIVVGDTLSHGATVKISTDGGKTFTSGILKYQGEGVSTCEFVASQALMLAPGTIIVADAAGNTTANTEPVILYSSLEQMQQMAGMASLGGFSRGGWGGGSYRSVSHSESDVDDITAYNAVRLVVDEGSMTQLQVGDEMLDLTLRRDSFEVTDDPQPTFTAAFTAWDGSTESEPDTLILTASDPEAADDQHSYTWAFSGVVYKKLAASGIDYLVLRIGDNVTALSTAGFSAGIRYSMYRAEGLPSKEFHYEVHMGMPGLVFEMDVTVSGETYRMSSDPTAEFYYYDVYNGSAGQFGLPAEG